MRTFINKKSFILLGIILLFVWIFWMFYKIRQLEDAKKEMAAVWVGTIQAVTGHLQEATKDDYMWGDINAPVTLIEYSDFECSQCQYFHPTLSKILNDYQGKVRLVTRMFPLPQNVNAKREAEAAACAGSLGGNAMFWKYGSAIFARTTGVEGGTGFPLDKLVPLAKELGLDTGKFNQCLSSELFAKRVVADKQSGEDAGVNSLPALFVTDPKGHTIFLSGNQSYTVIKAIVDESLAQL